MLTTISYGSIVTNVYICKIIVITRLKTFEILKEIVKCLQLTIAYLH